MNEFKSAASHGIDPLERVFLPISDDHSFRSVEQGANFMAELLRAGDDNVAAQNSAASDSGDKVSLTPGEVAQIRSQPHHGGVNTAVFDIYSRRIAQGEPINHAALWQKASRIYKASPEPQR